MKNKEPIITDNAVYFYTGTFSNWNHNTFTDPITNILFYNSEQAFMWYKADFFKDEELRNKIEFTSSAKLAKELGRKVKGFNESLWDCVKVGYMVYANYLKFSQNPAIKEELLKTGERILVECSPYDKVWGIGLGLDDPKIFEIAKWEGENLLGAGLFVVRHLIRQHDSRSFLEVLKKKNIIMG